jgi:hypothetical protein
VRACCAYTTAAALSFVAIIIRANGRTSDFRQACALKGSRDLSRCERFKPRAKILDPELLVAGFLAMQSEKAPLKAGL